MNIINAGNNLQRLQKCRFFVCHCMMWAAMTHKTSVFLQTLTPDPSGSLDYTLLPSS